MSAWRVGSWENFRPRRRLIWLSACYLHGSDELNVPNIIHSPLDILPSLIFRFLPH